jgi:hypothetical protein
MGADGIDTPPSADSPSAGTDRSSERSDVGPHRDEGTPATDAADSPADTKRPNPPASALARDEGHAMMDFDATAIGGTPDHLLRTDVHTDAKVETFMRGGVGPEVLLYSPRDDQGRFADKPGQIYAKGLADVPEGHPWKDPNTPLGRDASTVDAPLSISPADAAAAAQGVLTHYPGVDQWTNNVAHEGDRVWFASSELPADRGGPPGDQRLDGKSGFGVAEGELHDGWQEVALNSARYNEGSQIEPYQGNYRGYLDCYKFTQDTPVATGVASENTRYGNGGTPQMYVPDVKQLIADGKLLYVGTAQFEGTTAASWRVR